MKSNWIAPAAFAGVFALGAIAGAGGTRAYMLHEFGTPFDGPPREARAHLRIEAMRRQLDLSPDQLTKIKTVFRDSNDDLERVMKPCREELEALRKRTDERVEETLDEKQRSKFKIFSERMRKRFRGAPPFPPPPDAMP
jgi:Spy/CpxP family protein refolding chaperone